MPRPKALPIIDIEMKDLERVLASAGPLLPPEDFAFIKAMTDTLVRLTALVRERGATIARIRRLFGLARSEKLSVVLAPPPKTAPGEPSKDPACLRPDGTDEASTPPAAPQSPAEKRKGHGRVPASAYLAAQHIAVPHDTLRAGDRCPACESGNLFLLEDMAPIVRITGSAPLAATCWDCEHLRCATCGRVHTARAPEAAQGPKYDETAASMTATLRYGTGMPFNRLDDLQRDLQTPVPASTQWELVNERVELVRPAHGELVRLAAQGQVLHNDDSYMRILAFMGKRRAALLAAGELDDPDRTGLFTTAIVAIVAAVGTIVLFYTGRKHAGENLADLLAQRDADLGPPILMSDALSRNLPKGHQVLESNCICHGHRKIVDEVDNYPVECRFVLERFALVYKLDAECKKLGVSDHQRMLAHQRDSAPIMKELHDWMKAQLDERRVEPNCDLGSGFNYFLKRWDKFTLFLREPGAPLDNNLAERVLKMPIKGRKSSMFYRSQRGALVGDIYMTLIHTAELHHENPFDYLTELQRNYKAVADRPADWLPWNYRDTLARMRASRPQAHAAVTPDVAAAA